MVKFEQLSSLSCRQPEKKSLISQLFVIFPATKKTEGKSTKLRARYLFWGDQNITKCVCCVLVCSQKHTISSNVQCLLAGKVGNCFLLAVYLSVCFDILYILYISEPSGQKETNTALKKKKSCEKCC